MVQITQIISHFVDLVLLIKNISFNKETQKMLLPKFEGEVQDSLYEVLSLDPVPEDRVLKWTRVGPTLKRAWIRLAYL